MKVNVLTGKVTKEVDGKNLHKIQCKKHLFFLPILRFYITSQRLNLTQG